MSKTAKDVVQDTLSIEMVDNYNCLSCGHHQPESLASKALRVVASLDKAGLLAHTHSVSLDFHKAEVERLERDLAAMTRERDEARAGARNYWRTRYEEVFGELAEARASAASPEVMRVADAVLTYKREAPAAFNLGDQHEWPWRGVVESAHALSASSQPKAQEPRWTTERTYMGGVEGWVVERGPIKHGPFSADVCHKLADILNAEAAK